jgi:hypothetical protein
MEKILCGKPELLGDGRRSKQSETARSAQLGEFLWSMHGEARPVGKLWTERGGKEIENTRGGGYRI